MISLQGEEGVTPGKGGAVSVAAVVVGERGGSASSGTRQRVASRATTASSFMRGKDASLVVGADGAAAVAEDATEAGTIETR